MTKDLRCCANGTCIINAGWICWCDKSMCASNVHRWAI